MSHKQNNMDMVAHDIPINHLIELNSSIYTLSKHYSVGHSKTLFNIIQNSVVMVSTPTESSWPRRNMLAKHVHARPCHKCIFSKGSEDVSKPPSSKIFRIKLLLLPAAANNATCLEKNTTFNLNSIKSRCRKTIKDMVWRIPNITWPLIDKQKRESFSHFNQ